MGPTLAGLLCAALALALGLLPVGAAAQERVGDVEFSAIPVPSLDARTSSGVSHGYVEYRIRLRNLGTAERTVRLSYPRRRGQMDDGVVTTRTVRIAGGQEAVVSLYQPPASPSDERLEVRVEGASRTGEVRMANLRTYSSHYYTGDPTPPAVLLSRSVPRDFPSDAYKPKSTGPAAPADAFPVGVPEVEIDPEWDVELDSEWHVGPMGSHPATGSPAENLALLRSELPVSQWSPNWLGYSCYDAIVCSEREAEEMPPAVALAVRRYVECGGTLLIHGRNVPAAFSENAMPDGEGGRYVGMGHVRVSGADDWDAAYGKLVDSRIHIYLPEDRPANLLDMLVAEATVPVRGLFLLVLMFGVAIGPVNLWLLSRYRRRIWLWWNVPAISLLTCLLVFGYSMASEGWAGRGRTAALTLLDQRCRRATTIGYVSYYSPLAPGGLQFDAQTDAAMLDEGSGYGHYRYREQPTGLRFVDWTHGQHLTSGWMKARVPAYFQVRKNEDRRERLTVEPQADGSVRVLNALGADIDRLYVADASGRVLEGRNIRAGAEQTLSTVAGFVPDEEDPGRMRSIFTQSNWLGRMHEMQRIPEPRSLLAPGCYIAYLDRSPFIESPMAGVEPEHTAAIVYGITK